MKIFLESRGETNVGDVSVVQKDDANATAVIEVCIVNRNTRGLRRIPVVVAKSKCA